LGKTSASSITNELMTTSPYKGPKSPCLRMTSHPVSCIKLDLASSSNVPNSGRHVLPRARVRQDGFSLRCSPGTQGGRNRVYKMRQDFLATRNTLNMCPSLSIKEWVSRKYIKKLRGLSPRATVFCRRS
jgi:hypothetical protein